MKLTILCVTSIDHGQALNFIRRLFDQAATLRAQLVVAADGDHAYNACTVLWPQQTVRVHNPGDPSLERLIDQALPSCSGDYVLRIDDDEWISPNMFAWLKSGTYLNQDHWSFTRVYWWKRRGLLIRTSELFPDVQTRLSTREKSGGRLQLHAGSPFGWGIMAPPEVVIEHHKFLVKTYAERVVIADRYERFHPGFGRGRMLGYTLPEDAYTNSVQFIYFQAGEYDVTQPYEIRVLPIHDVT